MNTQLKKGILELCVLSVISKQDSYGYEIIDQIKEKIEKRQILGRLHWTIRVRSI